MRTRLPGTRRPPTPRLLWSAAAASALLLVLLPLRTAAFRQPLDLGPPQRIVDGLELYKLGAPALLDPPGPVAVQILKLDPARVSLESALARDQVMGRETVLETAARLGAVAAVNAGFFKMSGEPDGLLKIDGLLVSDAPRQRGAVAIVDTGPGPWRLLFDQVSVTAAIEFEADGARHTFPLGGVDTTRVRGRLMLFTPRYFEHTDTAPAGTEWLLRGDPPRVVSRRSGKGRTPLPADGFVLSFGGTTPPAPLTLLKPGVAVAVTHTYETVRGTPADAWAAARDVIGGAGLLYFGGAPVSDWTVERFREGFTTERHPRTMIGRSIDGAVWLVTVDGRQPALSLGMTFAELQRLAEGLGLTDALNLDGGGSTTMVVQGEIVNHPSDVTGPRPVSDALLVFPQQHPDSAPVAAGRIVRP